MKKRGLGVLISIICLALTLALALPVMGGCAPAEEKPEVYTVCMTQIVTHPALDTARRGFFDAMEEAGFEEGVNIDYIRRNPEGDMHVGASIADYFVSLKPDLIAAQTTPMAQVTAAAVEGTDIDVVFYLVTDPVAAGIVPSWTESLPHITGVSDWADVPTQIAYIQEIMPECKTLGVLYNAGEINSVVQVEELVNEVAPELGMTIVEATAAATSDVYAAAQSLVGRVDAMWMPTDNTIFAAVDSVIKVAEENDIPFFGSDTTQVEAGLAAAAGVDIYGIGREAAAMAVKILRGEATPGDIPPMKTKEMLFGVNPAAAERMGLTIPQAIIDRADTVVE